VLVAYSQYFVKTIPSEIAGILLKVPYTLFGALEASVEAILSFFLLMRFGCLMPIDK
jgi:hypothetical protein